MVLSEKDTPLFYLFIPLAFEAVFAAAIIMNSCWNSLLIREQAAVLVTLFWNYKNINRLMYFISEFHILLSFICSRFPYGSSGFFVCS